MQRLTVINECGRKGFDHSYGDTTVLEFAIGSTAFVVVVPMGSAYVGSQNDRKKQKKNEGTGAPEA